MTRRCLLFGYRRSLFPLAFISVERPASKQIIVHVVVTTGLDFLYDIFLVVHADRVSSHRCMALSQWFGTPQVLVPPRYQIPSVLVPPGYQNTERLRERIAREVVSFPSRCWGLYYMITQQMMCTWNCSSWIPASVSLPGCLAQGQETEKSSRRGNVYMYMLTCARSSSSGRGSIFLLWILPFMYVLLHYANITCAFTGWQRQRNGKT